MAWSLSKSSIDYLLNPMLSELYPQEASIQTVVQSLIEEEFQYTQRNKPVSVHRNKCSIADCLTAAVSKGLCVRHGGGTRCSEPGCNKRTKRHNRCYLHGGYILCQTPGCTSKAKRHGVCWAHGGGAPCRYLGCSKLAAKSGLCWSHGGGHRCRVQHCNRRAYKRQNYLCDDHAGI